MHCELPQAPEVRNELLSTPNSQRRTRHDRKHADAPRAPPGEQVALQSPELQARAATVAAEQETVRVRSAAIGSPPRPARRSTAERRQLSLF